MNITFIVNSYSVNYFLIDLINQILDNCDDSHVYIFNNGIPNNKNVLNKTFESLKEIDKRFGYFKIDPLKIVSITELNNPNVTLIATSSSIPLSDWIISFDSENFKSDFFSKFSINGIVNFDVNFNYIISNVLNNKLEIAIVNEIKLAKDFKEILISSIQMNTENGVHNSISKYLYFRNLGIIKYFKSGHYETFKLVDYNHNKINYFQLSFYYLKLIVTIFTRKMKNSKNNWKLAIQKKGEDLVFIKQPKYSFWADPFLIKNLDGIFLFFEELNFETKLGEIACVRLNEQFDILEKRTIFADFSHFSFPNVFYHQEKFYMLPENSAKNCLVLYVATNFPYEWESHCVLMDGIQLIDAVWVFHNGYYWIFANKIHAYEYDNNYCLNLYYSKDLFGGNWVSHIKNPIVVGDDKSRNAGAIILQDGKLFRPSQNCLGQYGSNILINEIVELSTLDYKEQCVERIVPLKNYIGTHTINQYEDIKVVDFLKQE